MAPINKRPTESTIFLPKFIAYTFDRIRHTASIAYHTLFLLSRLKLRNPTAPYTFGHHLFLTGYIPSSKIIHDDTYSNKVSVSLTKKIAQQPLIY